MCQWVGGNGADVDTTGLESGVDVGEGVDVADLNAVGEEGGGDGVEGVAAGFDGGAEGGPQGSVGGGGVWGGDWGGEEGCGKEEEGGEDVGAAHDSLGTLIEVYWTGFAWDGKTFQAITQSF